MKKILVLLVVSALLGNLTIANNTATDPNAKKILDAVSAKMKTYKGISANFIIKSFTSKGKPNSSKAGSIQIKSQKYIIKQGLTQILCDGVKIYNYDGKKTITITPTEESSQTLSPQNLLSNFYDKDFTYKLISSAGSFHEIELYPIDKRKNFTKVSIFIDKTKNIITKAKITDKSSNIIEFGLSNINTNATLNDASFVFNRAKYPKDVEVLD